MKNLRKHQRIGVAKDATGYALKMRRGSRRSVNQPIPGTALSASIWEVAELATSRFLHDFSPLDPYRLANFVWPVSPTWDYNTIHVVPGATHQFEGQCRWRGASGVSCIFSVTNFNRTVYAIWSWETLLPRQNWGLVVPRGMGREDKGVGG